MSSKMELLLSVSFSPLLSASQPIDRVRSQLRKSGRKYKAFFWLKDSPHAWLLFRMPKYTGGTRIDAGGLRVWKDGGTEHMLVREEFVDIGNSL